MKISIITVSYNSSDTIIDTLESVLSQTYKDIEYIIIDGESKDDTLNIIKSYEDKFNGRIRIISEPDKGIYDAMNKGIKMATGEVVGILNSDDIYSNENIVDMIVNKFKSENTDSVYGDLVYVNYDDTSKIIRNWRSRQYEDGLFKMGWHPAHPTFFVKKNIYDKYGVFNLKYSIAADYEIMLRFLEKYKIKSTYVPEVFVRMRMGGESNQNIRNIIKANIECYKSWQENGLSVSIITIFRKLLSKVLQYNK